jgi:adenosine deaminase
VARFRRTLDLALARPGEVVAIGLAGEESPSPVPFAPVVDEAAEAGIRLVHHAGETGGPASVREALGAGRATRIGHGVRVLEDPGLVAELREQQVPLEVCPSSNVALGLVPALSAHPLPRLLEAGLAVTLNTDVPSVTGAGLADEYGLARDAFGLSDGEPAGLAGAGVNASFAPACIQARLNAELAKWRSLI